MKPWRKEKLANLIKQEVSDILCKKVNDPRIKDVFVTRVELSADLKNACVYLLMREGTDREELTKALSGATGFISRLLFKRLGIKSPINVKFTPDDIGFYVQ
jgi:ribosome-binding factor A